MATSPDFEKFQDCTVKTYGYVLYTCMKIWYVLKKQQLDNSCQYPKTVQLLVLSQFQKILSMLNSAAILKKQ